MLELLLLSVFFAGAIIGGWIVWLLHRHNQPCEHYDELKCIEKGEQIADMDYQQIIDDLPAFLRRQGE